MARFEHYRDPNGRWQWRRLDDAGTVVTKSDGWILTAFNQAVRRDKVIVSGTIAPEYVGTAVAPPPPPPGGLVRVVGSEFPQGVPGQSWFTSAAKAYGGFSTNNGGWNPFGSPWEDIQRVLGMALAGGFEHLVVYIRPPANLQAMWTALGVYKQRINAWVMDVEDMSFPLSPPLVEQAKALMLRDGVDPKRLWLYSTPYTWVKVQGSDDKRFAPPVIPHLWSYDGRMDGWPTDALPAPAHGFYGGFTDASRDAVQLRGAEIADVGHFDGVQVHESVFRREALA